MMSAHDRRQKRRLLRDAPSSALDEIEQEGWTVEYTKGGHLRWRHPNGAIVFAASTPSDYRAWANHMSHLRRAVRGKL